MAFTYDEDIFSDLYKDVYGFRPRSHRFYDASPAEKQAIWDDLLVELDREVQAQRELEESNIVDFERLVAQNIEMGAVDRKTAVKWMIDAEDDLYAEGDLDYFKYLYGLPYGYDVYEGKMA